MLLALHVNAQKHFPGLREQRLLQRRAVCNFPFPLPIANITGQKPATISMLHMIVCAHHTRTTFSVNGCFPSISTTAGCNWVSPLHPKVICLCEREVLSPIFKGTSKERSFSGTSRSTIIQACLKYLPSASCLTFHSLVSLKALTFIDVFSCLLSPSFPRCY